MNSQQRQVSIDKLHELLCTLSNVSNSDAGEMDGITRRQRDYMSHAISERIRELQNEPDDDPDGDPFEERSCEELQKSWGEIS